MALSEKDGTLKSSGFIINFFRNSWRYTPISRQIHIMKSWPLQISRIDGSQAHCSFNSCWICINSPKIRKNICPHLFLRRRWSSSLALCWPRWAAAGPAAKCQMPRGWPRIWTTSLSSFGLVCWGKFTGKPWKTPYKKWENTYGFRLRFSPTNQSIDFLHLDVGQNGRPLMGPQMEMSSLV